MTSVPWSKLERAARDVIQTGELLEYLVAKTERELRELRKESEQAAETIFRLTTENEQLRNALAEAAHETGRG